jgi:hypothetical protein
VSQAQSKLASKELVLELWKRNGKEVPSGRAISVMKEE